LTNGWIMRKPKRWYLWTTSCVTAIIVLAMIVASRPSVAGDVPKTVRGYIWDDAGRPMEGASVTVEIRNPDNSVQSTDMDTSDSTGFYSVMFENNEWDAGDTINVTATWDSNQEDNWTTALAGEVAQYVNVSFPFEIEEFGSAAGLLLAGGVIACVAVAFVVLRKRKQ